MNASTPAPSEPLTWTDLDKRAVDTVRVLAADAVQKVGSDDPVAVNKAMRELPFTDGMLNNPRIQTNGSVVMDIMLVQVKTPAESKYPTDVYKVMDKVPGEQLYPTAEQSGCTQLQQ